MFALSSIPTATRVSSARPSVSSRSRACAVTTRASNADHHRDVPVVSRRALSLSASTLAELLRWCEEGEAEGVRSRLSSVAGRAAATPAELVGVLGEGVLVLK